MSRPELSIGLPVYNGARYLAAALDSILGQSFGDFEVLISDNASTDATEAIAREYTQRDGRVRYERNEKNLGAVPNYNRVFHRTSGRYFKWAAHDDTLEPDYLRATVELLRADPSAVLAHSSVRAIDGGGRELRVYESRVSHADSPSAAARFAALVLEPHACREIFAVMRRDALRRTSLQLPYHGCDRALLAEMGLLGRFVHVPAALFNNREHETQYVRAIPAAERAKWADTRASQRVGLPTWALYRQYWRAVSRLCPPGRERRSARLALARWWATNWHTARVAVEVASNLHPAVHRAADRARRALERRPAEPAKKKNEGPYDPATLAQSDSAAR